MLKKYETRQQRLNLLMLMGIGDVEVEALQQLHYEVIVPNLDTIVEQFYDKLMKFRDFRVFLSSPTLVQRLKKTQTDYLREMGIDCFSPTYFEERLRVGMAHARIGLPLSLYQTAFSYLHHIILELIPDNIKQSPNDYILCTRTLFSVITLDTHLAIEAYHHSQLDSLQQQLEEVQTTAEDMSQQAHRDALTGIYNRKALMQHMEDLVAQLSDDEPACVIMADIDHFKRVNDQHGHIAGDEVIRDVAARIRGALRSFDFVGRYGGEEFLIVLKNTEEQEGRDIAERICQRIANTPIQHAGLRHTITISMGLTRARPGEEVTPLIERADQALYLAKNSGRNRVVVVDNESRIIATDGRVWNGLL